jgi:cardiolipin synthase
LKEVVASAGVDVRIIGGSRHLRSTLRVEKYPRRRLHVRAIVRDAHRAFVGSQSLGKVEFDDLRELGVFVSDGEVVRQMQSFERDWKLTGARG